MKKEHQIIMLPSENKSILYKRNDLDTLHLGDFDYCNKEDKLRTNQHLYILSDESIKEGDWVYDSLGGNIVQWWDIGNEDKNDKKIIATTDPELTSKSVINIIDGDYHHTIMPTISKHIIEAYVKKPFDKVLVEYETKEVPVNRDSRDEVIYDWLDVPKLDSNNCIIIHPVKEKMYSREDMISFAKYVAKIGFGLNHTDSLFDRWIKENL